MVDPGSSFPGPDGGVIISSPHKVYIFRVDLHLPCPDTLLNVLLLLLLFTCEARRVSGLVALALWWPSCNPHVILV